MEKVCDVQYILEYPLPLLTVVMRAKACGVKEIRKNSNTLKKPMTETYLVDCIKLARCVQISRILDLDNLPPSVVKSNVKGLSDRKKRDC